MPQARSTVTLDLFLVGFGHVGRRFVRLLDEMRPALAALGVSPRIVGIATKRHGWMIDSAGINAELAATSTERGDALGPASSSPLSDVFRQLSQGADARVLIETTVLDVKFGEPASSHIRAAIGAGMHAITANKGPIACAYAELARAADTAGVSLLFEGAVMDGVPIFSLVRETLPGAEIRGFRGVVNSTTNHILSALERGEPFDAALARMQADGVAEADASMDVDGWDAAAKTAALANVWLDARITPAEIDREGVGPSTATRAQAARRAGKRLKLVATAQRTQSGASDVSASVRLVELDADDPLAILDGQANAIEIDTWPMGRLVVTQRDGGLEKTAYALVADLVTVARRVRARG